MYKIATKRSLAKSWARPKMELGAERYLLAKASELAKKWQDYTQRPDPGGSQEITALNSCVETLQFTLLVPSYSGRPEEIYVLRDAVHGSPVLFCGYEIEFSNLEFARLVKAELIKLRSDLYSNTQILKKVE